MEEFIKNFNSDIDVATYQRNDWALTRDMDSSESEKSMTAKKT